jgi:hypothetical protein
MRTVFLSATIALFGAACVSSSPRYPEDRRDRQAQTFDAYTTNGDFVRVQQDARSGDLVIVDPPQLSGDTVAMISRDSAQGMPLVAIQTYSGHRDNRDRDDRSRDDHHR